MPRSDRLSPGANPGLRLLRALSGMVAAGLVILAGLTAVAAWLTDRDGAPGPGTDIVLGHAFIALLAVVAQMVADRGRGRPVQVLLGALTVLGLAAVTLWVWWWN